MIENIQTMSSTYGEELGRAVSVHRLPTELFRNPDHIAYKCYDSEHFETVLRRIGEEAVEISYVELDNRRLASAWFTGPVAVRGFGEVHWVEVMEPKPQNIGTGIIGLEHMEFYVPQLENAKAMLNERDLAFQPESNSSHSWLSATINDFGHEVKFSDRKLSDIVSEGINVGEARVIKSGKNWGEL